MKAAREFEVKHVSYNSFCISRNNSKCIQKYGCKFKALAVSLQIENYLIYVKFQETFLLLRLKRAPQVNLFLVFELGPKTQGVIFFLV